MLPDSLNHVVSTLSPSKPASCQNEVNHHHAAGDVQMSLPVITVLLSAQLAKKFLPHVTKPQKSNLSELQACLVFAFLDVLSVRRSFLKDQNMLTAH